jgi:hypothetical protein
LVLGYQEKQVVGKVLVQQKVQAAVRQEQKWVPLSHHPHESQQKTTVQLPPIAILLPVREKKKI